MSIYGFRGFPLIFGVFFMYVLKTETDSWGGIEPGKPATVDIISSVQIRMIIVEPISLLLSDD